MMRIAIATVQVPFEYGGAEFLAANLKQQLAIRGHEAEIVTIPFKWYPARSLVNSMRAARLVDLTESKGKTIDLVIALKFPMYYTQHPNKVLWLLHQHREAYDLWGTGFDGLHTLRHGNKLRRVIREEDAVAIAQCKKVWTISQTVSERLLRDNGIASVPLYHPPPACEQLRSGEAGDYLFCPARLEELKRQDVLIEALRYTKRPVKIVLAGRGKAAYIDRLNSLIERYGLQDRVTQLGWIGEAEKIACYAHALAVYYGPFQEDYGYVTLEAFYAQKPVITLRDAGGPLEFVQHGVNGYIFDPDDPEAIAEILDRLYDHRKLAIELGQNGRDSLRAKIPGWDHVIHTLTAQQEEE